VGVILCTLVVIRVRKKWSCVLPRENTSVPWYQVPGTYSTTQYIRRSILPEDETHRSALLSAQEVFIKEDNACNHDVSTRYSSSNNSKDWIITIHTILFVHNFRVDFRSPERKGNRHPESTGWNEHSGPSRVLWVVAIDLGSTRGDIPLCQRKPCFVQLSRVLTAA
jgi:hypothetical protein